MLVRFSGLFQFRCVVNILFHFETSSLVAYVCFNRICVNTVHLNQSASHGGSTIASRHARNIERNENHVLACNCVRIIVVLNLGCRITVGGISLLSTGIASGQ